MKRRRLAFVLVGIACAVGVIFAVVRAVNAPQAGLEAYLQALVDRDGAAVIDAAGLDPDAPRGLLREDVIAATEGGSDGYEILDSRHDSGRSTFTVNIHQGDATTEESFDVVRAGSWFNPFAPWRVEHPTSFQRVGFQIDPVVSSVEVNGVVIPVDNLRGDTFAVVPGEYTVVPNSIDGNLVAPVEHEFTVTMNHVPDGRMYLEYELTAEGLAHVEALRDAELARCVEALGQEIATCDLDNKDQLTSEQLGQTTFSFSDGVESVGRIPTGGGWYFDPWAWGSAPEPNVTVQMAVPNFVWLGEDGSLTIEGGW